MRDVSPKSPSSNCEHGDQVSSQGTIGDLFRDYGEQYIKTHKVDGRILNLIRSIRVCKTPGLGGKRYECKGCGASRYHYFSCGNSQCPQCQGIKRVQWQDRLSGRMLKVPYVHTTFTLPHDLNGLARKNKKAIYGLLMRSCWQTINELCSDKSNVGAKPGMTAVLHTLTLTVSIRDMGIRFKIPHSCPFSDYFWWIKSGKGT